MSEAAPLSLPASSETPTLRERELRVLSELGRQEDASVAFQGLRRRLGFHPQALVRTLRSLETAGYVRRNDDGYALAPAGAGILAGQDHASPRAALRPVFAAVLPPHVTPPLLVQKLAHRWFQGLRWYGLRNAGDERVLTWMTEGGAAIVQLRVADGMLGLEVESSGSEPAMSLVGPLLEAVAAFYATPSRRPELPENAAG